MNEYAPKDPHSGEPEAAGTTGKPQAPDSRSRPIYDGTTESTRGMRDTSRRRRDAEVKLQQHLMEAKEHVPHHHDQDDDADQVQDRDMSKEGPGTGAPGT